MNKKRNFIFQHIIAIFFLSGIFFNGIVQHVGAQLQTQDSGAISAEIQSNIDNQKWQQKHFLEEKKKIAKENFRRKLRSQADLAYKNALRTFLTRIAYDSAVFLGSGDWGQGPKFYQDGWESYLANVATSAGMDFIETLAEGPYELFGKKFTFNVCNPNPELRFTLIMGFGREIRPREPDCSWQEFQSSWDRVVSDPNILDRIIPAFEPTTSDLSIAINLQQSFTALQEQKQFEKAKEREENQYLLPTTSLIANDILTPSALVRKDVEEDLTNSKTKEQESFTGDAFADAFKVFTSTLASKLPNLLRKGLVAIKGGDDSGSDSELLSSLSADANSVRSGKNAAREQVASLTKISFNTASEIDLLLEFESCSNPVTSLNNCTVDTNFGQAIRQGLTVQKAIEAGLLNPSWNFGYIRADGPGTLKEPDVNSGYAHSSMKRLRLARVLPLGWEIAADKIANGLDDGRTYDVFTLQEVIAGFSDSLSPFYHLVDPNWVLMIPPQQCRLTAPSEVLESSNTRYEYCADVTTCLQTDDAGSCIGGFGYCTREQNVWRFDGDSCPAYYDSCSAYKKLADNKIYPFLRYTVDFGSCDPANAGCRWYSTAKDADGKWLDTLTSQNRTYFNKQLASCGEDEAGCSLFIQSSAGSGTNLLPNGSFEEVKNFDPNQTADVINFVDDELKRPDPNQGIDVFLGWKDESNLGFATQDSYAGKLALKVAGSKTIQPRAGIDTGRALSDRTFTLSFAVKNCLPGSKFRLSGGTEQAIASDPAWRPYAVSVYYPEGAGQRSLDFQITLLSNYPADASKACSIDAIQLEESSREFPQSTAFKDYGAANLTMLKQPPSYLNCAGSSSDSAECRKYAPVCSEADVGCQNYTPVSYVGPNITAAVTSSDQCPSQCKGYRTYKQTANYFESEQFPLYFIANSAQQCSANDNGCSEFTNLDELEETGAEQREYYTFIRQCQRPDSPQDDGVFYTWIGSESTGYQLKTHNLVKVANTPANAAVYSAYQNAAIAAGVPPETGEFPAYTVYSGVPEDQSEDVVVARQEKLNELYRLCNVKTYQARTAPADCVEITDAAGLLSYRILSETISVSDDCHPLRKTAYNGETDQAKTDCQLSGGVWDSALHKACIYQAIPKEGESCPAAANQCRAYRGNFGSNIDVRFTQDFENQPDLSGWTGTYQITSEAISAGEHSLKVQGVPALTIPMTSYLNNQNETEINDVYLLSFWAKGNGPLNVWFLDQKNSPATVVPNNDKNASFSNKTAKLSSDWAQISLGPVVLDRNIEDDSQIVLYIENTDKTTFYIDSLRLTKTTDNFFLIQNSWETPAVCDLNPAGAPAPQYYLGCEEYKDSAKNTKYLKSFSSLCDENKIGCTALLSTQNSFTPWQETFNAICRIDSVCTQDEGCACDAGDAGASECQVKKGNAACRYYKKYDSADIENRDVSTKQVAEDKFVYLVNDKKYSCSPDAKGCSVLGLPDVSKASAEESVTVLGFEDVYAKNDPDRYASILCNEEYDGCSEYTHNGSTYYFRDPEDRMCVRKLVSGETQEKWYKKYPTCRGGSEEGLVCVGREQESSCTAGGGTCTEEECPVLLSEKLYQLSNEQSAPGFCTLKTQSSSSNSFDSPLLGRKTSTTCSTDFDCREKLGENYECTKTWVYECKQNFDMCTAFVEGVSDKPYYYLDNQSVDRQSCNNLVSEKEGCILFSNGNLRSDTTGGPVQQLYSSEATYQASESQQSKGVAPIDCGEYENASLCRPTFERFKPSGSCAPNSGGLAGIQCYENSDCGSGTCNILPWGVCRWGNDTSNSGASCNEQSDCTGGGMCVYRNNTNQIVTVRQDRMCGEWLECVSEFDSLDASGRSIRVCNQLARCRTQKSGTTECEEFLTDYCKEDSECHEKYGSQSVCGEKNRCTKTTLSASVYQTRDISWKGLEYSGFSLYEKFPVDLYRQERAGYCGGVAGEDNVCFTNADCAGKTETNCVKPKIDDWKLSYFDDKKGSTVSFGIDGQNQAPANAYVSSQTSVVGKSCRAYPESDAPFDASVDDVAYRDAKRCFEEEGSFRCECSYRKKEAGGFEVYIDDKQSKAKIGSGVCSNSLSLSEVQVCNSDSDCGAEETGVTCIQYDKTENFYGWAGYCLEKDTSRPVNGTNYSDSFACLTWYPAGMVKGEIDTFNYAKTAGYTQADNRDNYCLNTETEGIPGIPFNNDAFFTRATPGDLFGAPSKSSLYNPGKPDTDSVNLKNCYQEGEDRGECHLWCSVPQQTMFGCYAINDDDGADCQLEDTAYADGTRSGRISYPWTGPKIYRQNTRGLRMQFVTKDSELSKSIGKSQPSCNFDPFTGTCNGGNNNGGACSNNNQCPGTLPNGAKAICEFSAGWGDLSLTFTDFEPCDKDKTCLDLGEVNQWDSDTDKEAFDNSNNCTGEGCLRAKVNWVEESGSGFEKLDSVELWAIDRKDLGIFAFESINIFDMDHCNLLVSAIDPNLDGPNVLAYTGRVWDGYTGSVNGLKYSASCEPYGSISLGSDDAFSHRVVVKKIEGDDGKCTLDRYHAELGNDKSVSSDDLIFELYARVNAPRQLLKNFSGDTDVKGNYQDYEFYDLPDKNFSIDFSYTKGRQFSLPGPQISSVKYVYDADQGKNVPKYSKPKRISLNSKDSGNIQIDAKGRVNLSFFAYDASGSNQESQMMPLRKISVDWDMDDLNHPTRRTVDRYEGSYKNHKESCGGSTVFGNTPEACVSNPFSYSFVYQCPGPNAPNWNKYSKETGITDACMFRPRVQVMNNWGWCNEGGADTNTLCGFGGCYGGQENGQTNVCDNASAPQPWAYYDGYIIVYPPVTAE